MNPWGEMRADRRAAMIACILANANRDPARTPEAFTLQDFMPYLKPDPVAEETKLAERIVGLLGPRPHAGLSKAEIKRRRREIKEERAKS